MPRKDASPRRWRRLPADRLSDLPDDLLLEILRRLDTRTALRAAALSRRWASLPRELPAMDLKVTDILPPRYYRLRRLYFTAMRSNITSDGRRLSIMTGRYERRAMRALVHSVEGLLASRARRRVERLSVEVFAYSTSACISHLVVDAVDSWGVRDLEVVASLRGQLAYPEPPPYSFRCGLISRKPGESRLRSLKLVNCLPPPLQGFTKLTTLVLLSLPAPTPAAAYEGAVAACPQLQVLHLVYCQCRSGRLVLDTPMSEIRELLVDGRFMVVELRSLPKLESLTCLHAIVVLRSTAAAPCLARVSFTFSVGRLEGGTLAALNRRRLDYLIPVLMEFFQGAINVKELLLRFTGPEMWILPNNPFSAMSNLRRLLVADVPSSWDISWPHLLIEAAPLLETLYVHASHDDDEPSQEVPPRPSTFSRHRHLKELVVIGFQRTERQLHLVRFAVDVSTALNRVSLLKHGYVLDKGPRCDWEVVSQQSTWSDEDRLAVLDGIGCSLGQIQVVLG